jgi:hypothetical protein
MRTRLGTLCVIGIMLFGWVFAATGQETPAPLRLLLIDETKTFTSTMKVAGTIGALRQMGLFDVSVRLADLTSDYDDPLAGFAPAPSQAAYDLVLILPRGLDTKSGVNIWLVSAGLDTVPGLLRTAVNAISMVVDQVFAGSGRTIDVSEDLWPGILWAVYVSAGWME